MKALQSKKEKLLKTNQPESTDVHPEEEEFKTLLETEKERRLKELP